MQGQAEVAQKMGVPKENVKILRSGDILELREDRATIVVKRLHRELWSMDLAMVSRKYCSS